jgi:uncharacterized protein (DUF1501 family)
VEAGALGQRLRRTARIIKAGQGLEIVGIDWNGWDHHINQGGPSENDVIWRMLSQLGSAVHAFFEDIRPMRRKVTLLVMTEFGRTTRENGNRGTDHGRAGLMFLAGGSVKGGKIYGEWTGVDEGRGFRDRDLPVTTDYRRVLGEVAGGFLGLDASKNLFPRYAPPAVKLGLFA